MPSPTHIEPGLLLTKVDYRDSDLIVSFFTPGLGRVSALARGARSSRRRFGGVLEPMHTLRLHLDERATSELMILKEASISQPRTLLVSSLDRLQAAGRALNWVRQGAPQHTEERELFESLSQLLDRLNGPNEAQQEQQNLAEFGLFLLSALGFGLHLRQCVRCSKPCTPGQAAYVDARRGGLVCRSCGGAAKKLSGPQRERLALATEGTTHVLVAEDVEPALDLVERALSAHLGIDPS